MNVTLTGAKTAAPADVFSTRHVYEWGRSPAKRFSTNYRRA
jgi:hypothetical protein